MRPEEGREPEAPERRSRLDLDSPPYTLDPADVAEMLGVGVRQARDWSSEGHDYSFRDGRRNVVPKASRKRP